MPADLNSLERLLRRRGPLGLAEISASVGCTTKTAQRLVATASDAVVAAGQTQRRRFSWRREIRSRRVEAPLYRIDAEGRPQHVGLLRRPQSCHVDATALAWPTPAEASDGWYNGLPYPLYDMSPQVVDEAGLGLAPSYDQLLTRYAPQPGGDVISAPLSPTLPLPAALNHWRRVAPRALSFWQAANADKRIGKPFRALCGDNAMALA